MPTSIKSVKIIWAKFYFKNFPRAKREKKAKETPHKSGYFGGIG